MSEQDNVGKGKNCTIIPHCSYLQLAIETFISIYVVLA